MPAVGVIFFKISLIIFCSAVSRNGKCYLCNADIICSVGFYKESHSVSVPVLFTEWSQIGRCRILNRSAPWILYCVTAHVVSVFKCCYRVLIDRSVPSYFASTCIVAICESDRISYNLCKKYRVPVVSDNITGIHFVQIVNYIALICIYTESEIKEFWSITKTLPLYNAVIRIISATAGAPIFIITGICTKAITFSLTRTSVRTGSVQTGTVILIPILAVFILRA